MPPILKVVEVKPSWGTNPVNPDSYVWIDVYVKNVGDEDAGLHWVRLVNHDTNTIIETQQSGSLLPGETEWAKFPPRTVSAREYFGLKEGGEINLRIETGIGTTIHDISNGLPKPEREFHITLNIDKNLAITEREYYTLYGQITWNGIPVKTNLVLYVKAPWTDGFKYDHSFTTDENGEFALKKLAYIPPNMTVATLYFKVVYVKSATERYESNIVSITIGKVTKNTLTTDRRIVPSGEYFNLTGSIYYPFPNIQVTLYRRSTEEGPFYESGSTKTDEQGKYTFRCYMSSWVDWYDFFTEAIWYPGRTGGSVRSNTIRVYRKK